jgi:probable O-glycosylation ligase (exosortase A-associated)
MLRAIFVGVIILYGLYQSFRSPFYALLFYLWIAYFRPEYWLWSDWVTQLNLSLIVGVLVLGSTVLSGRRLRLGIGPCLMLLLMAQSFISTMMSPVFDFSFIFWQDFAKSTIISLLIVSLVDDERSLRLTFLVIACSLGLEAVKQGWAQMILNPGAANENFNAVLGDNNGVAIGMFMLTAFMVALARTAPSRKEKLAFRFSTIGVLYRGISTFSRGGFLACGALGIHTLIRARRKFAAALGIAFVCLLIVPVMSDKYWTRMSTISTATEDEETANDTSAGRIHFWRVAVIMANAHPLTGVGHNAYSVMYNQYDPSEAEFGEGRAVHSSWFAVLAELGYPGLLLFLMIIGHALLTCRRARRLAKKNPDLQNLGYFAMAIEGALVTFAVGGTFVTFQYVEMLWHTLALSMVVDRLVAERVAALNTVPRATAPLATPVRARIGVPVVPGRPLRV